MTLYEKIYHAINGKKTINKIAFKNHVFYLNIYLDDIIFGNKVYCFNITYRNNDYEELMNGRYKIINKDQIIQKIKKVIIQTVLDKCD